MSNNENLNIDQNSEIFLTRLNPSSNGSCFTSDVPLKSNKSIRNSMYEDENGSPMLDVILNGLRSGDIDAFKYFIESRIYYRATLKVKRRLVGSTKSPDDDLEEIMQESVEKLLKALKSKYEIKNLVGFFIRICLNTFNDFINKYNKQDMKSYSLYYKNDNDEEVCICDDMISGHYEHDEIETDLNDIKKVTIDKVKPALTTKQKVVLDLWLNGHSYKEISKILKIPESTVKNRLQDSRENLKDPLKKEFKKTGNSAILKEYKKYKEDNSG